MEQLQRLREIVKILREPGGCDWDRVQTPASMRHHLLEEAYEVVDAIHEGRPDAVREELGDLLFIILFYARLYEEKELFSLADVAAVASEKLVRRHPHVFGDVQVDGVANILSNWHRIKQEEKAKRGEAVSSVLDGIEETFPSLMHSRKVQEKVARIGFDWKSEEGVFAKIREELAELEAEIAAHPDRDPHAPVHSIEDEYGDLLFTIVNLSRHLKLNPEVALRKTTHRFISRFRHLESLAKERGIALDAASPELLDSLWNEAKRSERGV